MIIKRSLINEFLVVLMALILILSQTIFDYIQVLLELTLFFILIFLLLKRKLKIWEISLLLLVIVTQLMSMLIYDNSLNTFMLNTKVIGLAFLSFMYFRHNATVTVSMKVLFIICLSLVLIQYFITIKFPVNISQSLMRNVSIYTQTNRPLGLFMDFHTSAYFLAIYFIGINLTRKLFFIDLLIMWLIGVKTSFLALVGQKFFTAVGIRFYNFQKASFQITSVIVGVVLLLTIFLPIFFSLLDIVGYNYGNSSKVMAKAIINPSIYIDSIYLLPMDINQHSNSHIYYIGDGYGHIIGGELGLVNIMILAGAPLGFILLYFLLKFTPSFRVFILLTLLHFTAILNPLIIYLVFMFENMQKQRKEE